MRAVLALLLTSLLALADSTSARDDHEEMIVPQRASCRQPGLKIDSVWVEQVGRRALDSAQTLRAPLVLEELRWVRTRSGLEEGALARFVSSNRTVSSGFGGLVWVDVESGCALVLRRYE